MDKTEENRAEYEVHLEKGKRVQKATLVAGIIIIIAIIALSVF